MLTTFPDFAQASTLKRHWGAESEAFTGGDALFAMLERGWSVGGSVVSQRYWYSNNREASVYHFFLVKGSDAARMSVVSSPLVLKFIEQTNLELSTLEDPNMDTKVC
jgi:hypothetical protein